MISRLVILICFLSAQVLFWDIGFCEENQFNLEVNKPGIIEQALLSQAIENDPVVKNLDKELSKAGLVRNIGSLAATSNMVSVRILNLSSNDSSIKFLTNGLQLGSDAINITTIGYKMYKEKKLKKEIEERINFIKSELFNLFARLESSSDDVEAKNRLIGLVGENSTNDYLNWLGSKAKGN